VRSRLQPERVSLLRIKKAVASAAAFFVSALAIDPSISAVTASMLSSSGSVSAKAFRYSCRQGAPIARNLHKKRAKPARTSWFLCNIRKLLLCNSQKLT
jgi:hypothetical protein